VNCYRIHQKSLNFVYPFKFYSNFTNKNVSWLHFSWPTQYINGLGKLNLHYFSKVHKVKFYYHLLLVRNTLFLDLFWLYFKDCFHKDDCLRCVCKPSM